MTTDSQPAPSAPNSDESNIVLDNFGRPLTRWAMHFDCWSELFCIIVLSIIACLFQNAIKATPPYDPLRQLLFVPLIFFFVFTAPSFLISLVFPSSRQPKKPIDFHSKRFIIWLIVYGLLIIPMLIFSVNSYLSPVQPSGWPFNLLIDLLPESTPKWDAFWQSIVLNPLSIICIGGHNFYITLQTYRDQLKAMAKQKTASND